MRRPNSYTLNEYTDRGRAASLHGESAGNVRGRSVDGIERASRLTGV